MENSDTAQRISVTLSEFLQDRTARRRAARTVEFYREKVGAFIQFAGDPPMNAITPALLRQWLADLAARATPGGMHAKWRALRALLRWWADEYDAPNPAAKVKVQKPRLPVLPPASDDVLRALVAVCRPPDGTRDRAILLMLLDTGLRAGELCALDLDDVDVVTGQVHVRHGKGDVARTVYAGETCRRALRAWIRQRGRCAGALFPRREGGHLAYFGLRAMVLRRAKEAGVPMPPLHSFRRAYALACLRAGVDLETLRRLLGHADLSTVQRYLALVDDDLRRAAVTASPADRL